MSNKQQALWFLLVGSLAGLVHFVMLIICVELLGIVPIWANVLAFLIAFVVSFIGHFKLTFNTYSEIDNETSKEARREISSEVNDGANTPRNWLKSLQKWFVSSVAGFLLNQALFFVGLKLLGEDWYAVIWFVVTAVVTVVTFALGKLWAFNTKNEIT